MRANPDCCGQQPPGTELDKRVFRHGLPASCVGNCPPLRLANRNAPPDSTYPAASALAHRAGGAASGRIPAMPRTNRDDRRRRRHPASPHIRHPAPEGHRAVCSGRAVTSRTNGGPIGERSSYQALPRVGRAGRPNVSSEVVDHGPHQPLRVNPKVSSGQIRERARPSRRSRGSVKPEIKKFATNSLPEAIRRTGRGGSGRCGHPAVLEPRSGTPILAPPRPRRSCSTPSTCASAMLRAT